MKNEDPGAYPGFFCCIKCHQPALLGVNVYINYFQPGFMFTLVHKEKKRKVKKRKENYNKEYWAGLLLSFLLVSNFHILTF